MLGIAEEVSEDLVNRVNAESVSDTNSPARPKKRKNEHLYSYLLQGKLDHLKPEERRHFEPVLIKYAHVFHDESPNDFKGTKVTEPQIVVGDASPIRKSPYRTPFALRQEMQNQVDQMLKKGIIRPSTSPWSAPSLLVPKRSPDGKPKYRFCVDFRALNVVLGSIPIPCL